MAVRSGQTAYRTALSGTKASACRTSSSPFRQRGANVLSQVACRHLVRGLLEFNNLANLSDGPGRA